MKILHLEDSVQDAELTRAILKEEWPDCEITLVETKLGFINRLADKYDIILSDFSLGSFDGLEALVIAREMVPDTPFIFVSGSIGEERAIEAVRRGAHDYVIKDRMKRLTTSIRRAMSESSETRLRRLAEDRTKQLADFINKAREAITVTDLRGRFIFWNEGAARITGWSASQALGRTIKEVHGSDDAKVFPKAAVTEHGEWRGEVPITAKDGRRIILDEHITLMKDDAGQPKAFLRIGADITEKKRLEEQFLRTQRIETIGMLAAGIAHDLNNVLAPIALGMPVLRERARDPADEKLLAVLEKSAERGTSLVKQILAFARGSSGERVNMQLAHLGRDIAGMVQETFPRSIVLDYNFPADLWLVNAHPTQMHQVLLNLCVNARDAMPQGGKLTLRAENRPVVLARYVIIEVSDTGTGIPPDVLDRIWEPFFSTKGSTQGTGLGLSTVRGIVENHHGRVEVRSIVGMGTKFTVYLPAAVGA